MPFGKTVIFSANGKHFYIDSKKASGWLPVNPKDDWLPFIFWKVKLGLRRRATKDEVRRYKEALKSLE